MGDLTIPQRDYDRLKESETRARAEAKAAREHAEHDGIVAWKEGRKSEGLKLMGSANAPAVRSVLAGAAIYYVATSDVFDKYKTFQEHWWLKPLLAVAIGYYLWRRGNPFGHAMLSTAAALFVQAYRARPKDDDKNKKPPQKADGTTQGFDDDAGRWDWSEDTYGRGRWIHTPSGAQAYITEGSGARSAERIAERVFEHARAA
jgi:hypothetical protein